MCVGAELKKPPGHEGLFARMTHSGKHRKAGRLHLPGATAGPRATGPGMASWTPTAGSSDCSLRRPRGLHALPGGARGDPDTLRPRGEGRRRAGGCPGLSSRNSCGSHSAVTVPASRRRRQSSRAGAGAHDAFCTPRPPGRFRKWPRGCPTRTTAGPASKDEDKALPGRGPGRRGQLLRPGPRTRSSRRAQAQAAGPGSRCAGGT